MSKLAINGGTPIRETLLSPCWPGGRLYDEREAQAVYDVCMAKSPNRYSTQQKPGRVKTFEKGLAEFVGVNHALGVTSGTAAILVALKAAGIGPGDKVIVPACTFLASAGAVVCAGAVPVFCDVDDTLNLDPKKIGDVCDKYTKAIITVPLLGNPCQMDEIMAEAKKHNLIVIEDVAQSMGASLHGKKMGAWGDIAAFSMQMNKIITTGDGGAVVTNHEKMYERAVRYHDQGMFREKEGFLTNDATDVFIGQNYRMSELTGAVACVQLERIDGIISEMRRIKKILKEELSSIDGLTFKRVIDDEGDIGSALVMFLPTKEQTQFFIKAMMAENIVFDCQYGGRPVYMIPQIFHQKTVDASGFPFNQFDEKIVYTEDMCPVALDMMPRNAFTFIEPSMTDKDIEDIIKGVKKVCAEIL